MLVQDRAHQLNKVDYLLVSLCCAMLCLSGCTVLLFLIALPVMMYMPEMLRSNTEGGLVSGCVHKQLQHVYFAGT